MTRYQIFVLTLFAALQVGTLVVASRGAIRRRDFFLWSLLWLLAAGATVWPNAVSAVANLLGIDRGADLVSYLGIVAMLVGFWWISLHQRRQQRELTTLVRELALRDARPPENNRGD